MVAAFLFLLCAAPVVAQTGGQTMSPCATQTKGPARPNFEGAFVPITSVVKRPEGGWMAALAWGTNVGVINGSHGSLYRAAEEGHAARYVNGQVTVQSVTADSASAIVVPSNSSPLNEPRAGDLIELFLSIPAEAFDGIVLRAALHNALLTTYDEAKTNLLSVTTAFALHSEADQNQFLAKLKAELNAVAVKLPDLDSLKVKGKGPYACCTLREMLTKASAEDVRGFLEHVDDTYLSFAGYGRFFAERFAGWVRDWTEDHYIIEREAAKLKTDAELVDYLHLVNSHGRLIYEMDWLQAAMNAADQNNREKAAPYIRLLRAAAQVKSQKAYQVMAQMVEGVLLTSEGKADEAIAALQAAVRLAEELPEETVSAAQDETAHENSRTYLKARTLYRLAFADVAKFDYLAAARAAEQSREVLRGHIDTQSRVNLYSGALEYAAYAYRTAGEFAKAKKLYEEAYEAFGQRTDRQGLDSQLQVAGHLATLARDQRDYSSAFEWRKKGRYFAVNHGESFAVWIKTFRWELGNDYWFARQYDNALGEYQAILPEYACNPNGRSNLLLNIGNVQTDAGRFDKAGEALGAAHEEALRMEAKEERETRLAEIERWQAHLFKQQKEFKKAEEILKAALGHLDSSKPSATLATLYADYATLLDESKRFQEAERQYKNSADQYHRLGQFGDERLKLGSLANLYINTGRAKEAEAILGEVLKAQTAANDGARAETLYRLARLHLYGLGANQQAADEAKSALDLATQFGDSDTQVNVRDLLADYYVRVGNEKEALKIFQEARNAAQGKNRHQVAWFSRRLGGIHAGLVQYDLASEDYKQARDYFEQEGEPDMVAGVWLDQAYLDLATGKLDAAQQSLQNSKKFAGENPSDYQTASQLTFLSTLRRREGKNREAIELLTQAEKLWEQTSNLGGRLEALNQRGIIQMHQREYDAARETWTALSRLAEGYVLYQAEAQFQLAETLVNIGLFDEAKRAAEESIRLGDKLELIPEAALITRANWALLLLQQTRLIIRQQELAARYVDEATQLLNVAEAGARKAASRSVLLTVYLGRGRRQLLLADSPALQPALKVEPSAPPPGQPDALDAAVDLSVELAYTESAWESRYLRGALRSKQGQRKAAEEDLSQSIKILEREAENYAAVGGAGGSHAALYQADQQRPFLALMDTLMNAGDDARQRAEEHKDSQDDALRNSAPKEKAESDDFYLKARDVLDRLHRFELMTTSTSVQLSPAATGDQAEKAQYESLIRQLQGLEAQLEAERRPQNGQVNPARVQQLTAALDVQQKLIDTEKDLIQREHPELAKQLELRLDELNSFAEKLSEDEALLEPVLIPGARGAADRVVVFVVRYQKEKVATRSFTRSFELEKLRAAVEKLNDAASTEKSDFDLAGIRPSSPVAAAAELYDLLIARAEPFLQGVHTVLISATGPLRYIPFHLLVSCEAGKCAYLADRFDFVYLTGNGTITASENQIRYKGASVVAVANPNTDPMYNLPEAEQEVRKIEGIWHASWPDAFKPLYGKAQVGDVRDTLSDMKSARRNVTRILHIAAHGSAGGTKDDTYLMFADGPLKEGEVGTRLRPEGYSLAVLSGCDTAKGTLNPNGTGVTGLAYAFEKSGIKTIVATLWTLDSKTGPTFMESLYKSLADGKGVVQALREARTVIRNNPETSRPYYWAPFILVGNWK